MSIQVKELQAETISVPVVLLLIVKLSVTIESQQFIEPPVRVCVADLLLYVYVFLSIHV